MDSVQTFDYHDDPTIRHLSSTRLPLEYIAEDGNVVDVTVTKYTQSEKPHAYIDFTHPNGNYSRYEIADTSEDIIRSDKVESPRGGTDSELGARALEGEFDDPTDQVDPLKEDNLQDVENKAVAFSLEQHTGLNGQPVGLAEMQHVTSIVAAATPKRVQ